MANTSAFQAVRRGFDSRRSLQGSPPTDSDAVGGDFIVYENEVLLIVQALGAFVFRSNDRPDAFVS